MTPEIPDYRGAYVAYHDTAATIQATRSTYSQPKGGGVPDLNMTPTHSILKNKQVLFFLKFILDFFINFRKHFF